MKDITGKPLLAVWRADSIYYTKKVAALTRGRATELYKEAYNLTEEEVVGLKLTRVKHLWSDKQGVIV